MRCLTIFVPMSDEKMTFVQHPFAPLMVAMTIDFRDDCHAQTQDAAPDDFRTNV